MSQATSTANNQHLTMRLHTTKHTLLPLPLNSLHKTVVLFWNNIMHVQRGSGRLHIHVNRNHNHNIIILMCHCNTSFKVRPHYNLDSIRIQSRSTETRFNPHQSRSHYTTVCGLSARVLGTRTNSLQQRLPADLSQRERL